VSRLRLLNPFRIRRAAQRIREVLGGGGPAAIRVAGVGAPRGLIIPSSRVVLEVRARDGSVTRFEPEVPIPFPYAWAYRIARRLGVPLVSTFDPDAVSFEVGLPRR
jgi:hypothetical protein